MGSGTKAFRRLPKHKKLYGDKDFHIRPKGCCEEEYHIAIRPVTDKEDLANGYIWQVEGEFGMGAYSYKSYRTELFRGDFKNTRYVYYPCDFDNATPEQRQVMENWATDGSI